MNRIVASDNFNDLPTRPLLPIGVIRLPGQISGSSHNLVAHVECHGRWAIHKFTVGKDLKGGGRERQKIGGNTHGIAAWQCRNLRRNIRVGIEDRFDGGIEVSRYGRQCVARLGDVIYKFPRRVRLASWQRRRPGDFGRRRPLLGRPRDGRRWQGPAASHEQQ